MAYVIWELDGTPSAAVTDKQIVTVAVTPAAKLNFWSLAIIILAVWLVVKEL